MGKDKEVSNAYVRIGAKNADLKRAFSESELVAKATLGRMGRAMQAFGQSFAGRIGLGGPAGLLAGGAAAVGVGVAAVGIDAEKTAKQMRLLGIASGEMGIDFDDQLKRSDAFSRSLGKLIGFTIREGREMAILGTQYGFAGDRLTSLMRAGSGLAIRRGREPIEGMRALIDSLFKGRKLDDFGVFTQGPTAEAVFRSGEQRGEQSRQAFDKSGKPLTGGFFERLASRLANSASAVAEFATEGLQESLKAQSAVVPLLQAITPNPIPPGLRGLGRQALDSYLAHTPFTDEGADFFRNAFGTKEAAGRGIADDLSGLRREELGVGDNVGISERGPANARNEFAPERSPFPDNFVEVIQTNTAAMDRNTAELQRQPAVRPP